MFDLFKRIPFAAYMPFPDGTAPFPLQLESLPPAPQIPHVKLRSDWNKGCNLSRLIDAQWSREPISPLPQGTTAQLEALNEARLAFCKGENLKIKDLEQFKQEGTQRCPNFIIEELLKNAGDACFVMNPPLHGPKPQVGLDIYHHGERLFIEVSDHGCGIAKTIDAGRLFHVARGPLPAGSLGRGSLSQCGYGLLWAKVLTEAHGGIFVVHSPGLYGFNTTMQLIFPGDTVDVQLTRSPAR